MIDMIVQGTTGRSITELICTCVNAANDGCQGLTYALETVLTKCTLQI